MESFVEFRNARGKKLRGIVHLPGRRPARRRVPGVVFFHGFTGDRMESHWIFVKCARALAEEGLAALRFDFYGSGESEGQFREVTLQGEIADALRAVEFFARHHGIEGGRLGLLGLSLGGTIAATVAHRVRAQALVLWAALAHPAELRQLAEKTTRPLPGETGAREYSGHEISRRFLDGIERVNPLSLIARVKAPTLVIHPEHDEYLPVYHAEDYFRATGAAIKEKIIISGADHTFSSVIWEREVIDRTTRWFRKHLG